MEYLTIIGTVVGIAGALLLNLLSNDLYDRCPKLARSILQNALARLPEEKRERYDEEWSAMLLEADSKTQQLWIALQVYLAAGWMRPPTPLRLDLNYVIVGAAFLLLAEGTSLYIKIKMEFGWLHVLSGILPFLGLLIIFSVAIRLRRKGRYTNPSLPSVLEGDE